MNHGLAAAYRRGRRDRYRGLVEQMNPYPDNRTTRGQVTWSRAYRKEWSDGWRAGDRLLRDQPISPAMAELLHRLAWELNVTGFNHLTAKALKKRGFADKLKDNWFLTDDGRALHERLEQGGYYSGAGEIYLQTI